MTEREALKLALEALSPWAGEDANHTEQYAAYHAIRKALAEQPAQQEHVATSDTSEKRVDEMAKQLHEPEPVIDKSAAIRIATSLGWTPQRTWVGLTDEQINALLGPFPKYASEWGYGDFYQFARDIEAKLKIKNT